MEVVELVKHRIGDKVIFQDTELDVSSVPTTKVLVCVGIGFDDVKIVCSKNFIIDKPGSKCIISEYLVSKGYVRDLSRQLWVKKISE